MNDTTFTDQQIADWREFEAVRASGAYNMMTEQGDAADAAGLSIEEYWFCLHNYEALSEAVNV